MGMNIKDFNNKINRYDPLKTHRTLYPTNADIIFFPIHIKHLWYHKTIFNKLQRTEFI